MNRQKLSQLIRKLSGKRSRKGSGAFTLIELLVSMAILSILLLLLAQLLDQIQRTWQYAEGRVSQFREARVAFDIITKNLSQASLNTYWDYEYNKETNLVESYKRQSELHFKTFEGKDLKTDVRGQITGHAIAFQAPLGFSTRFRNLSNLFNARGYYVLFGDDEDYTPSILKSKLEPKYRFRIMEYRPPAEENQIYIDGDKERLQDMDPEYTDWFQYKVRKYSHPLAENIITMVLAPRDTIETVDENKRNTYSRIASNYQFDSNTHENERFRHQVPPLVRVTMVAIDETSAVRLEADSGTSMPKLIDPGLFKSSSDFDKDIDKMSEDLQEKRINFKVFSTMVALRSAKWSTYEP